MDRTRLPGEAQERIQETYPDRYTHPGTTSPVRGLPSGGDEQSMQPERSSFLVGRQRMRPNGESSPARADAHARLLSKRSEGSDRRTGRSTWVAPLSIWILGRPGTGRGCTRDVPSSAFTPLSEGTMARCGGSVGVKAKSFFSESNSAQSV
jgi:hypothetical protein